MAHKRVNVKSILADADLRRKLMVSTIQATQAREGIDTSVEQADRAYYVVTEAERGAFFELDRFAGDQEVEDRRHEMFVSALRGDVPDVRHDVARRDFAAIDGSPLAYERVAVAAPIFRESASLDPTFADAVVGLQTSQDDRFVRFHWEVKADAVGMGRDWWVFAKGGEFSRFYQAYDRVVLWRDNGAAIKEYNDTLYGKGGWSRQVRSPDHYGEPGLTWPLAGSDFGVRVMPPGCIFAHKGPAIFLHDRDGEWFVLALINSEPAEYLLRALLSRKDMGGRWEVGVIKRLPVPRVPLKNSEKVAHCARLIHNAKQDWDRGNELSMTFDRPWILRYEDKSISGAIDQALAAEDRSEKAIRDASSELNADCYRFYGIPETTRRHIERSLKGRRSEVIWPQMEGTTVEEKRMEHVWRLLSYLVKRVIEADDDGVVPFGRAGGDAPLIDRVRQQLAALFPGLDEHQVEVEIANELKRGAKGYRKCANLEDWLANAYFEYHASLYKKRPIYWHIASSQGMSPFAFGALVHYHRFDKNRLAKLRASYVRDTIEDYRREAALADKAGRAEDRLELQAKVEEAQALDKRLQQIQEGHHEGPEGGDRDFRILTPWKDPDARPKGWDPDLDDGVKVNIGPFDRAGVLRVSGVAG